MFPFVLAALIGQMPQTPLKQYHLNCPAGHQINVMGREHEGKLIVEFPISRPAPDPRRFANFGVDTSHFPTLAAGQSWYGGNVAARPKPVVGANGKTPDRVHLTFIGSQVEREAARKDLEASPGFAALAAEMGDALAIQDFGPENPMVAGLGFADGGHPDILVQRTSGKVLWRGHKYPGADTVLAEIRRAHPKNNPAADPGDGQWSLGGLDLDALLALIASNKKQLIIGAVLGLGLVLFLWNRV